jgi:hypothetical protein
MWPNHGLPHGTPSLANEGYVKIFLGLGDSNPEPSTATPSQVPSNQQTTRYDLLCVWVILYLKLCYNIYCGGSGQGLAPTPVSLCFAYNHGVNNRARIFKHNICLCFERLYVRVFHMVITVAAWLRLKFGYGSYTRKAVALWAYAITPCDHDLERQWGGPR